MKILKYLLYIILALVIIFFGAGLLTKTISYESEITVNKPVSEAWAVMSDPSKLADWLSGYKRTELISGTANTPGAVSNVYFDQGGQEMVIKETIKEVKDHELMTMDFETDFMNMDYKFMFEEIDGKTKISSETITTGNGLISRSIVAFMKGTMKSQEDSNMSNLKKVIEENTTVY